MNKFCSIADRVFFRQLDNGLRVYVLPNHSARTVSIQAVTETGSIHEDQFLGCGLSHFLEHMMFAGTKRYPGSTEVSDVVTGLGGSMNACTSYTYTKYYLSLPSDQWDTGISILADILQNPLFPADRFDREKEVILRECAMGDDNPSSVLFRKFFSSLYRIHPMRIPVIGLQSGIRTVTRDMMVEYYRKRYAPSRTFFVVVGCVDPDQITESLGKITEKWETLSWNEPLIPTDPVQSFPVRSICTFNDPNSRCQIGWRSPSIAHPDIPALDVFTSILGGPFSSPLVRIVENEKRLALDIVAGIYANAAGGMAGITITAEPDKLERACSESMTILDRYRNDPVSEKDLKRAVLEQEVTRMRSMRANSTMASLLAQSIHAGGSPEAADRYLEQLHTVTPEQIMDVVNRYFRKGAETVVTMVNKENCSGKKSVSVIKNLPVMKTLDNGLRVIFLEDKTVPLIDLTMIFPGGVVFDPAGKPGLLSLLAECIQTGTKSYNEAEFNEVLDDHGITLNVSTGNNTLVLTMSAPADEFEFALSVLKSMLTEPAFRKTAFTREVTNRIEDIKSEILVSPEELAQSRFRSLFYGSDHPYGRTPEDTIAALSKMTPKDLSDAMKNIVLNPAHTVTSISGCIDKKTAFSMMTSFLKDIPWTASVMNVPSAPEPFASLRKQSCQLSKNQSVVIYGVPGIPASNAELEPYQKLLFAACNGLSSRLMKEVRDKNGLAYHASLGGVSGFNSGALYFVAGTHESAVSSVYELFEKERKRLAESGFERNEFESAKARVSFQEESVVQSSDVQNFAAALAEFWGYGYDDPWKLRDALPKITLEMMNDFLKKIFSSKMRALVTITPSSGKK